MSKNSFGEQLVKGFVRSAVNQVGRDGGKVISNQVYGDRHSTPIRHVSSTADNRTIIDSESECITETAALPTMGSAYFWTVIGFIFGIFGGIFLVLHGKKLMNNAEYVTAWKTEIKPTYVKDMRYKEGARYDGDTVVRAKVVLQADVWQKEQNVQRAKVFLYGGYITIALFVLFILLSSISK